jgi:hypothetical protein
MKIDITPVDLQVVLSRLRDYCELLEAMKPGPNFPEDEWNKVVQDDIKQVQELASRLQAQRIIR